MSVSVFGALAIALGGVSLVGPYGLAIAAMVLLTLFRTAAAFNLPALGGLSVLGANVFLAFYIARAVRRTGCGEFARAVSPPSAGFYLALLALYALVSALIFPRLMAGATETIALIRSPEGDASLRLRPLETNLTYVTQLVYFLGNVGAFMASFALSRLPDGLRHMRRAIVLLFFLHIALALADLLTYATGTAFLLDFIRTANYALLTDVEKAGLKRIAGSFSEASAFASFTLVLFATCCSLWLDRQRPALMAALSLVMLVLLLISTSGTAYVGLALFVGILLLYEACGPFVGRPMRRPVALLLTAGLGLCLVLAICVLAPTVGDEVQRFVEETIFGKLTDASGRERMMWNHTAFQNFLDTGGFGVGIGGARASSYLLVLLSNVGWPGLLLFAAFVGALLWRSIHPSLTREEVCLVTALRCGIVGTVVAEGIVGAVFDLGILFYVMAGAVAAAPFGIAGRAPAHRARAAARPAPAAPPQGGLPQGVGA